MMLAQGRYSTDGDKMTAPMKAGDYADATLAAFDAGWPVDYAQMDCALKDARACMEDTREGMLDAELALAAMRGGLAAMLAAAARQLRDEQGLTGLGLVGGTHAQPTPATPAMPPVPGQPAPQAAQQTHAAPTQQTQRPRPQSGSRPTGQRHAAPQR